MTGTSRLAGSVVCVILPLAACHKTVPPPPPVAEVVATGSLELRVVDVLGQPVSAQLSVGGDLHGFVQADGGPTILALPPGEHQLVARSEGFRPATVTATVTASATVQVDIVLQPERVVVTAERIDLRESIYFASGSSTLAPESLPLLADVSTVLQDMPEIRLVSVDGHTCPTEAADAAGARALGKERADAVVRYLVQDGVEAGRLVARSYGAERPIDVSSTEAGCARNRRVELFIIEHDG